MWMKWHFLSLGFIDSLQFFFFLYEDICKLLLSNFSLGLSFIWYPSNKIENTVENQQKTDFAICFL